MKKGNGFTLAEILGIMVLLAIIALITKPIIDGIVANSREKSYKTQIKQLNSSASNWLIKYGSEIEFDGAGYYYLTINQLSKSEFLEDKVIIDPRTNEEIKWCAIFKRVDNIIEKIYVEGDCVLP